MDALIFNIQRFSLHDGNGIRTTIFFKGCNLCCKWCANPESQSMQPEFMQDKQVGQYYSLDEIMVEVLKDKPFYDKSNGGVTLSGGEPLLQSAFVIALCDALHAAHINVGIETAASIPQNIFSEVLKRCDFALIDLKHWDARRHKQGTGTSNHLILSNIRYALSQKIPVTIRIPVIPGFNSSKEDANAYAMLLVELVATDVHLLPFHQMGENKYQKLGLSYDYSGVSQLHDEDLKEFADILTSAGLRVQIGG